MFHFNFEPTNQPTIHPQDFMQRGAAGESPASRFYSARRRKDQQEKDGFEKAMTNPRAPPPSGTFHPDNLEFRLDDNYQTRMVCGPPAHVSVYC